MKYLLPICFLWMIMVTACNGSGSNDRAVLTDSATGLAVDTTGAIIADPGEDPDTTDAIPAGGYSPNNSSLKIAGLVRASLQLEYKVDLAKNNIDSLSRKFIFFEYDLNDDGYKEIFVGLTGPYFCGTGGCTIYLLDNQSKLINTFTISGYPLLISNDKTKGWKDIIITSGSKNHTMKFDGKKYPNNPTMQPVLDTAPADGLTRALDYQHQPYPWFRF